MRGGATIHYPYWTFEWGELEAVVEDAGMDGLDDLERVCHMKPGRFDYLEERGFEPMTREFRKMSIALDMDMDELFDAVYSTSERG